MLYVYVDDLLEKQNGCNLITNIDFINTTEQLTHDLWKVE